MFNTTLLLSLILAGPAPTLTEVVDKADWLLENRHFDPDYADSAYSLVRAAREDAPGDRAVLALWARVNIQLGDDCVGRADRTGWYTRARGIADSLRKLDPADPAGHFLWAIAQAKALELQDRLSALTRIGSVKQELHRTLELDSGYLPAYAALAGLLAELPEVLGGSRTEARSLVEQGIRQDPNYTRLWLELARLERRAGNHEAASAAARTVLEIDSPTYPADTELEDRPAARRLLDRLDNR